ncbi:MAG: nucleotidyltransferase domain-containing protein [Deltaproteobacteria bacterium]|nr:nucleotidyltransferase domain-containing protein [Deltaproteobacteria bacterium]
MIETRIKKIIKEKGPVTGAELLDVIDEDPLILWRACHLSKDLAIRVVGTRYLRFDRRLEGFARLSPSILREFLTYSIIGLSNDPALLEIRVKKVLSHIEEVSRAKSDLAYNVVSALAGRLSDSLLIKEQACFIIAGDIVFNMAHDVPRPERSTGKIVKGSDMDIVVIVDDNFSRRQIKRLDEEIYKEKYRLLINPHLKEEIDYIVKDLNRVKRQLRFDTFKHMVACKILQEGTLLYGSEEIFHTVKTLLKENGIIEKISAMAEGARAFRKKAKEYLVREDPLKIKEENLDLFYPTEESEEFE